MVKLSRGAMLLGGGEAQEEWHEGILQSVPQPWGFHCQKKNTLLCETAGEYCSDALAESPAGSPLPANRHSLGRVCCDLLCFCQFHSPLGRIFGAKISALVGGGDSGAAVISCSREAGLIFLTALSVMDEAKAHSKAACTYAVSASWGWFAVK